MRVFSHSRRPVHLGPFPMDRLGRGERSDTGRLTGTGMLQDRFAPTDLGHSINSFLCALDAVREGDVAANRAQIPEDLQDRAKHMKAAGYCLDAALMGIAPLKAEHFLAQ